MAPKKTAVTPEEPAEQLSYEQAREELVTVVRTLEQGGTSLEESLALWERGEALATLCQNWLDGARTRLDAAIEGDSEGDIAGDLSGDRAATND